MTSASDFLDTLRRQANDGQLAFERTLPAVAAKFESPTEPLHERISERLSAVGFENAYCHQAEAYDASMRGQDTLIVSGTNSGKSLCYLLPTLQFAMTEPVSRALYLYPTKALAQDQLGKLEALIGDLPIRAATYDGDTPKSVRSAIRSNSHIVLTNPDMLHVGILPGHESWTKFFKSLRIVVIDEIHAYRGVFGSHVAGILRRLLRLCEWHRSRPLIVGCTATIGNPREHFVRLTGREPTVIDRDGSPQGTRTIAFWNPQQLDDGRRMSSNVATSDMLAAMVEAGLHAMAFSRSRSAAELVARYAKESLARGGVVSPEAVDAYRAGYTSDTRRKIEKALFSGKLSGVSATTAMELGVDVGGLDSVVMNGYPGTRAGFWQQVGRAGRGSRESLAALVARDDPLEQFLMREPKSLFEGGIEVVATNLDNPHVLAQQLRCAAQERPISSDELAKFSPSALSVSCDLETAGDFAFGAERFFYTAHEGPAGNVNIRGTGGPEISLRLDGSELGTMDFDRALRSAHAGAIYLHRGASYLVEELDLDAGVATLAPTEAQYYTLPLVQSVVEQTTEMGRRRLVGGEVRLASIRVTDAVVGFRKTSIHGNEPMAIEPLELPTHEYDTLAVRIDFEPARDDDDEAKVVYAVHAIEHALTAMAPMIVGCDRGDIGSAWYAAFPDTLAPALFVFDRAPGGIGLAEKLFERFEEWAATARRSLAGCDCEDGCPACLLASSCECNNENLDKRAAIERLGAMIGFAASR